jgi:hypothetical protein
MAHQDHDYNTQHSAICIPATPPTLLNQHPTKYFVLVIQKDTLK